MRIVLTGATGFIGRRLAARLLDSGHSVVALVRREGADLPAGIEPRVGALSDQDFLRRSLADAEAVCHVAGEVKSFTERGFLAVNEGLTAALAEGVRRFAPAGAPLLYVSSQAAGGPCASPPGLREADQPAPVSHYGFSKLLGERAALALAGERPVALCRPAMVYGPGDWAFVPLYNFMARGVLPALGPSGQRFSIVHVDDLVEGLALALESLTTGHLSRGWQGGVLHFAGPGEYTWEDYAAVFGAALERRVRTFHVPGWALLVAALSNSASAGLGLPTIHLTLDKRREAMAEGWLLDCTRTRRLLGWTHRNELEQGARETLAWCRARGLLPSK